jgi:UDP-3-O-[3-hydroxymyristoyl] N-acetylglucosamine deacetylase
VKARDGDGPVVTGLGVHGGRRARVRLHRSEGPIRFRAAGGEVAARVANVVATDRCIVLGAGAVRVATVEHLLAALRVGGFWTGVVVEVEGDELPILDGSAGPWREAVDHLGSPPPVPPALEPTEAWAWHDGAFAFEIDPGPERLDVEIDFAHAAIGVQSWVGRPERYVDLLDARTFAFASDVDALRARGLLRGADEGSGILFAHEGPHVPLRSADEPVRHKALDALGDLALLGRPLAARVRIRHGSHQAHVTAMHRLLSSLPHPDTRPA